MFKKYLLGFLLTVSMLVSINLLIIFLSELKNLGVNEYTLFTIAQYTLFLIPQNFLDIFPYALLIGSMIAFGSMAYHSEILAINSNGIGVRKTIFIIMLQTFLLASVFTYIGNYISPDLSIHAK
jgi:lipopolysaccharide export LptBFGC system permease protein LptF